MVACEWHACLTFKRTQAPPPDLHKRTPPPFVRLSRRRRLRDSSGAIGLQLEPNKPELVDACDHRPEFWTWADTGEALACAAEESMQGSCAALRVFSEGRAADRRIAVAKERKDIGSEANRSGKPGPCLKPSDAPPRREYERAVVVNPGDTEGGRGGVPGEPWMSLEVDPSGPWRSLAVLREREARIRNHEKHSDPERSREAQRNEAHKNREREKERMSESEAPRTPT